MKVMLIRSIKLLLMLHTCIYAYAQIPLVYNVENTGSACTKPALPTLANLKAYANLPDPFAWANGSGRIGSFADWECRRNEIKAQIENYEIGARPPKPANISATWAAGTSTLTVKVTEGTQTLTLTSKIVLPSGAGPFPAIIGMNSPTGSLPATVFSSRNIAQITYNHDQVTTYNNKSANDPFYKLYPNLAANGQYCAWAWGVSRIIDGLELVQAQLPIDLKHIGVTGCSYAGKMALFSGALDERIALTIPEESGGGGSAAWRVSETLGAVEKLGATNNQWFMQSMFQFAGANVPKLPHDHHELLAMVAPRALLVIGNGATDYVWLAEEASYVSCRAAEDVYKTLGISDRFGFSQVGGHAHCSFPASQNPELTAFVDKFLLGKTTTNTSGIAKNPFPNTDYNKWISAWKGYVLPVVSANAPVVSITAPLTNASYTEGDNITINATATVATGSISKIDFYQGTTLLGSDASAPYTFVWNNVPAGTYQITAKATSAANDAGSSSAVTVQVIKAVFQTSAAPAIDGTIDAVWNNYTSVPIVNLVSGTVSSATDLSGNWKAMWDAANLYILVQVTDDIKRNDGGTDVYNDDGVEVYVDFGNTKATTYGANDQQYTFRWNDATAAYEINKHSVAGIVKGTTNTATGYIMEMSIPWSTIGGVPTVNNLEGFDIMISDDDDGAARDGKLAWTATTDDTWSNPSLMGTIVLKGLNCTPPAATITATGTTSICSGGNVLLNANTGTGFTYAWKKDNTVIAGATAAAYTATLAGSYTLTVTSAGCSATSSPIVVTVNALSAAIITAAGTLTFCTGESVLLTASSGTSYKWMNGSAQVGTDASYTATASGSYTVEVTNAGNCKATSAATIVTVHAAPVAPAVTAMLNYCQGAAAAPLTATGTALKWYPLLTGGTAFTTVPIVSTATAGTINYYVSQTTNGCESARATIAVTVQAAPAVPTVTPPISYCQGAAAAPLTATGTALKWYPVLTGGTAFTTVPIVSTATAGTINYYVSQTTNGCESARSAITVTVNALPQALITASGTTDIVNGGSVILYANTGAGLSYKWFTGSVQTGTASAYTATDAGNYSVEVTNAAGCSATSAVVTVTVSQNQLSVITITSIEDHTTVSAPVTIGADISDPDGAIVLVEYLDGNTVIGTGTSEPYLFVWTNPGAGTHTITIRVTDSNGGMTTSEATTITTGITTGLQTIKTNIYSNVYPVPAKDNVLVETAIDLSAATFKLVNILGEEHEVFPDLTENSARIDVSELSEGTYILFITQQSNVITQKICVIK